MLDNFRKYSIPVILVALLLMLGCSSTSKPTEPAFMRGDINLNGVAFEEADAVLFSYYFVYGQHVFTVERESQIKATDVNRDGLTLGVADLTYLFRKKHGDALPLAKLVPVEAIYNVDFQNIIGVNIEVGAAALQLRGIVEPTLLPENMEMEYAYDASSNVTRVLVYNYSYKGETFTGEFLNTRGSELVSIEMATYDGARVIATEAASPSEFSLYNYPNPFSDSTVIYFTAPFSTELRFEIRNESGQVVLEFNQHAAVGYNTFIWIARDDRDPLAFPAGIYYCTMFHEEKQWTIEMQKRR